MRSSLRSHNRSQASDTNNCSQQEKKFLQYITHCLGQAKYIHLLLSEETKERALSWKVTAHGVWPKKGSSKTLRALSKGCRYEGNTWKWCLCSRECTSESPRSEERHWVNAFFIAADINEFWHLVDDDQRRHITMLLQAFNRIYWLL